MKNAVIIILLVAFISFLSIGIVQLLNMHIKHEVHKGMVKNEKVPWDYVSFDTFLKEFEKIDWDIDSKYPKSRFDNKNYRKNHIHAGIILFDGKGMVIKFWDMLKFMRFEKKLEEETYKMYTPPQSNPTKGLWCKE